jgi:hypothetical protein
VVGVAAVNQDRPDQQVAKLIEFINALHRIRGLEQARIIFSPEANYALEGRRLVIDLANAQVENVYALHEDVRGNEGIRMSEELKKEMVLSFNALLMQRKIRWHPYMVSIDSPAETQRKGVIDELARYQRQLIYNENDACALPKERFTGKIGGTPDDRAITIQMVQKAREFWLARPDFYSRLRPIWTPY